MICYGMYVKWAELITNKVFGIDGLGENKVLSK